ncbi:hypothetical protein PPACK8108_LOCUS9551 [Phakopsora pachyrhizi]|uniref:Secreted protein n=1 Tax=Phakopsora pachyrhizi TaxID=170000 RepID=A0AAV0AY97_PHAPC|nr:hypothetical protein PPACK8108_LOCUS9551 [Phakopsora pachyrhizi]
MEVFLLTRSNRSSSASFLRLLSTFSFSAASSFNFEALSYNLYQNKDCKINKLHTKAAYLLREALTTGLWYRFLTLVSPP